MPQIENLTRQDQRITKPSWLIYSLAWLSKIKQNIKPSIPRGWIIIKGCKLNNFCEIWDRATLITDWIKRNGFRCANTQTNRLVFITLQQLWGEILLKINSKAIMIKLNRNRCAARVTSRFILMYVILKQITYNPWIWCTWLVIKQWANICTVKLGIPGLQQYWLITLNASSEIMWTNAPQPLRLLPTRQSKRNCAVMRQYE